MGRAVLLMTVLVSLGFAPAPFLPKAKKADPLAELQGSWFDSSGLEARVVGNTFSYYRNDKLVGPSYTITINASSEPRQYDCRGFGQWKDMNFDGIYKIDGDTLTMCSVSTGNMRPMEFLASPGAGIYIMKRRTNP